MSREARRRGGQPRAEPQHSHDELRQVTPLPDVHLVHPVGEGLPAEGQLLQHASLVAATHSRTPTWRGDSHSHDTAGNVVCNVTLTLLPYRVAQGSEATAKRGPTWVSPRWNPESHGLPAGCGRKKVREGIGQGMRVLGVGEAENSWAPAYGEGGKWVPSIRDGKAAPLTSRVEGAQSTSPERS